MLVCNSEEKYSNDEESYMFSVCIKVLQCCSEWQILFSILFDFKMITYIIMYKKYFTPYII